MLPPHRIATHIAQPNVAATDNRLRSAILMSLPKFFILECSLRGIHADAEVIALCLLEFQR